MSAVMNALFGPSALTPHGFCLAWQPGLIWLHALSDLCIASAYYSIPLALLVVVRKRADLLYPWMVWLFAAFIMACGTTHVLAALTLWVPAYWAEGVLKGITAVLSIATAALLWPLIPGLIAMPSQAKLRQVNARLALSEARYRALFTRAPVAMHSVDAGQRLVDVSDAWLALLGYSRPEVIGQDIGQFQQSATPVPAADSEATTMEHRYMCKSGDLLDVLVSSSVEEAPAAPESWRAICALTDVTARKRAEAALGESEERLRQTEKLSALGQLAGGIAHDFNNILQAVQGGASMLRKRAGDPVVVDRLGAMIEDAAQRGASVSRRLLAFTRREELRAEAVDVSAMLEGLQELLAHTLGVTVAVTLDVAPDLPALHADRGQLETVLLNLATNARDAMPQGGSLALRAQCEPADGTRAARIRLAVADTGTGMDDATLARATEPFFTTKSNGRGTGLGLSIARSFADQSGGTLSIQTRLGQGTTVELCLPVANPAIDPAPPPAVQPGAYRPRLMIVDDDSSVREILAEQLAEQGFGVLQAEAGSTALALLDAGEAIDVLISDLAMPAMDGISLIRAAQQRRPGLPALLLTGFAATADTAAPDTVFTMLRKPITGTALADHARRAAGVLARV